MNAKHKESETIGQRANNLGTAWQLTLWINGKDNPYSCRRKFAQKR